MSCACGCAELTRRGNTGPLYLEEDRDFATPCWVWQLAVNLDGYGTKRIATRRWYAHRWMYELHEGPVPAGLVLDHLCRVRACVRPDHLEPVTHFENVRRGRAIRFTDAQIAAMRDDPRTNAEVARVFGTSSGYVCDVRHGKKRREQGPQPAWSQPERSAA